jgi:DNA-3-methyladenine glycosylase II
MIKVFHKEELPGLCDRIIEIENRFGAVVRAYGYPPFWFREPGFETLVLTILEQQVSLASAASAFNKLKEKTGQVIPENVLNLSDEELRSCYFSRQKTVYVRELAKALTNGRLDLAKLNLLDEETIRIELTKIKGIGNWTVDTYLLMSLHHADIFPVGDLATVRSMKELGLVPSDATKEELTQYMKRFSPNRSVATYLLWHSYIQKRGLKL